MVAVSEGISDKEGNPIASSGERDSHGNVQLSGTGALGDALAAHIKGTFTGMNMRVRADTFGYFQRSYPTIVSLVDAREAREVGQMAVRHAASTGENGSVAIRRVSNEPYASEYFITQLSGVARETVSMPDAYINAEGNGISTSWLNYIRPLVGELPVIGRL